MEWLKEVINYENDKENDSFKIPVKVSKEKAIYTILATKEKNI